jgi:colanic acid/amylovoran biosynthesis glycosyltransferase
VNYSPLADQKLAANYRLDFPKVDSFHAVSKALCKEAAKYGADLGKCRVVYSGLDLNEFPFEDKQPLERDQIRIISVGRPHWKKGHHFALDAMNLLAKRAVKFQFLIVGGVTEELLFQIHDLDLQDSVTILETIPFDEVKTLISEADILLLASVEEGIPNVILEAMALGTIVLSTDCGGVSEVLTDGANGFVVPMRDPEAIAAKIGHILQLSDHELDEIRRRGRKTIEHQHDQRTMVREMIDLYRSVLAQN